MPTKEQLEELVNYTTVTYSTETGANGMLFTSTVDPSKSILIPRGGYAETSSSFRAYGYTLYLYSSSVERIDENDGIIYVWTLSSGKNLHGTAYKVVEHSTPYRGYSVRGVIGGI